MAKTISHFREIKPKLLVICGQTGTGKTSLAFYLADLLNGELVSADSRQVYKKLDIGTGKDLLKGSYFDKKGFYEVGGIKIWGYDLIDPKKDFSVGSYLRFARKVIGQIHKKGKLPILVGGTGLYIKGVVDGIPTAFVPQNPVLRENLKEKSAAEMYEILAQLDPIKAGGMNQSDRQNPRRLVRAIEVASWSLEKVHKVSDTGLTEKGEDVLFVGLMANKDFLEIKIKERVDKRIKQGLETEIKNLLKEGLAWDDQSMSSLGYRQWRDYFTGKIPLKEVLRVWCIEENNYAKRQLTWFKKDSRINWFDVSKPLFVESVEKMVKKWYSRGHGT